MNKKIIVIRGLIGMALILFGAYVALDWNRLFDMSANSGLQEVRLTPFLKNIVVLSFVIIAWLAGRDSFDNRSTTRVRVMFCFIMLADLLFLTRNEYAAVGVCIVYQFIFMFRNGQGLIEFVRRGGLRIWWKHFVIYALFAGMLCYGCLFGIFYQILSEPFLLMAFTIYTTVLCMSLFVGLISRHIGFFPRTNAIYIAIGMVLFVMCDLTVGLNLALRTNDLNPQIHFWWLVSSSITWMLYTPSLLLLALSAWDFKKLFPEYRQIEQ